MRNNYIGNYPTPLLRGVVHIFLCFWLMQYYSPSYFISIDAYIGNILLICGCFASIAYHDIYYPKYEYLLQKIDHIFVFTRIIAFYLLTTRRNIIKIIILFILLWIFKLVAYNILRKQLYLVSFDYYVKLVLMIIITLMYGIYYHTVYSIFINISCLYFLAIINYLASRVYIIYSKIWSLHETFHLLQSIADVMLISHNLQTNNVIIMLNNTYQYLE